MGKDCSKSFSPSFVDNAVLFGLYVKLIVKCVLGLVLEVSHLKALPSLL